MTDNRPRNNKFNPRSSNFGSNERKKQGIRGHDAALHHFQRSGEPVTVILQSEIKLPREVHSSNIINGKLTQYDAYTVTLIVDRLPHPLIIFKSNILGLTKALLG